VFHHYTNLLRLAFTFGPLSLFPLVSLTLTFNFIFAFTFCFSTDTSAIVRTLPVSSDLIDQRMRVTVQFPGFAQEELEAAFTYTGNPKLSLIRPLETNVMLV
jgi:hypothetical protein